MTLQCRRTFLHVEEDSEFDFWSFKRTEDISTETSNSLKQQNQTLIQQFVQKVTKIHPPQQKSVIFFLAF